MKTIRDGYNIRLEDLENHPKNVRKDYGDLTELIESIWEMGLLQNLVVVAAPDNAPNTPLNEKKYWVVAGNRRLLALKEAYKDKAFATATCRIVEMTESEQIAMMLTENINRSSLTPLEEADGFQMMLDLGDTVDGIAKKTGFGKTTVRHRLNIAKIDRDVISQKNEDGWQVSLKDFEKLEKVPPEKRSEILEKSMSPQNLDWQIEEYVREEKKKKDRKLTLGSIEAKGITKKPDKKYTGYAYVKAVSFGDECPDMEETEGTYYWDENHASFTIYCRTEEDYGDEPDEEELKKAAKKEETDAAIQKINDIMQSADDAQHDFVNMKIEAGGLYAKDDAAAMANIWCALTRIDADVGRNEAALFFTGKRHWELQNKELEEAWQQYLQLSIDLQMLVMLSVRITEMVGLRPIVDRSGRCNEDSRNKYKAAFTAMSVFGFSLTDEQLSVIFGDSELYTKEEE